MSTDPSTPLEPVTCQQVLDFLMSYIDGELPEEMHARFEAHLQGCSACTSYLDGYTKTVALARESFATPRESVELMPDELVEAILDARRKPTPS